MILITGATGHLGKATINALLSKGVDPQSITGLIRDEAKADWLKENNVKLVKGDYNDYESLLKALEGVQTLFLISSSDVVSRQQHHENVIRAAKATGVGRIVYTSATRKREDGTSAIAFLLNSVLQTESLIRSGGFAYTFLRNALYADVLPMFLGTDVLSTGVFLSGGNGRANYATRQDLGEASANVLTSNGHDGKEYTLTGPESYSFQEIADILTELSGKPVLYHNPSEEIFVQNLNQAGVPPENIGGFTMFLNAIKQGEFETERTDLPVLLGRAPATLKSYLESVYFIKRTV